MIKEFSFKNYLSFKDKTTFNMEADIDGVTEHPEHIVDIGQERILKVASIYGPNGSGKSNLLKAFSYFRKIIQQGLDNRDENEYRRRIIPSDNTFDKFILSDYNNNVIEFEAFFINNIYEIGYSLQIEKNKDDIANIKYENMSYRNINETEFVNMYERNYNKFELSDELTTHLLKSNTQVSDQITFVSYINQLYINKSGENIGPFGIINSFMNEISSILYLRPTRNNLFQYMNLANLYKNEKIKLKVIDIMNKLDINITNINIEKIDQNRSKLYVVRNIDDKDYSLEVNQESDGTQSLLYLLPRMIEKVEEGGILIIDEIDSHLHPKLTKSIVEIFTDANNKKGQLIFTSHDIINMTNDLFRRDEIWFVVKNDLYESELMALTDFVNYKGDKVRKDAKYSKQYLEGKYGADPFIQKGVYWNGKDS